MEIKLIGGFAILLKGKKEAVLVNPEKEILAKNPARIVIYNKNDNEDLRTVGDKVSIIGPGEYEIGGIEVDGFNGGNGNTVYIVTVDGVSVGLLGSLNEELNEKKTGKVSGVDVLIADVDGGKGIGAKSILNLGKTWGANYILPVGGTETETKAFLDEADSENLEAVDTLKIDKDSLPEGTEIVLLKESN